MRWAAVLVAAAAAVAAAVPHGTRPSAPAVDITWDQYQKPVRKGQGAKAAHAHLGGSTHALLQTPETVADDEEVERPPAPADGAAVRPDAGLGAPRGAREGKGAAAAAPFEYGPSMVVRGPSVVVQKPPIRPVGKERRTGKAPRAPISSHVKVEPPNKPAYRKTAPTGGVWAAGSGKAPSHGSAVHGAMADHHERMLKSAMMHLGTTAFDATIEPVAQPTQKTAPPRMPRAQEEEQRGEGGDADDETPVSPPSSLPHILAEDAPGSDSGAPQKWTKSFTMRLPALEGMSAMQTEAAVQEIYRQLEGGTKIDKALNGLQSKAEAGVIDGVTANGDNTTTVPPSSDICRGVELCTGHDQVPYTNGVADPDETGVAGLGQCYKWCPVGCPTCVVGDQPA